MKLATLITSKCAVPWHWIHVHGGDAYLQDFLDALGHSGCIKQQSPSPLPLSQVLVTTKLCSLPMILFYMPHISGLMQYLSSHSCFISRGIRSSRFICIAASVGMSIWKAESHSSKWVGHILLIHSSINENSGGFHLWLIVNNALEY